MDRTFELTLEQEFSLRSFADCVEQMSHQQAQEFLIEQYRFMMTQEMMYQDLLMHQWNLELDLTSCPIG